ncbi:hypothetical protein, partial [Pseudoalteromonas citrea]|uniref:hypothetical protein n=1 Tax=Pseudoalteromonas citrea TaxID=43655 RepID=UPI001BB156FD
RSGSMLSNYLYLSASYKVDPEMNSGRRMACTRLLGLSLLVFLTQVRIHIKQLLLFLYITQSGP